MRIVSTIYIVFCFFSLTAQRISDNTFQLVNSPSDEINAVVSPDGKMLFLTIANHPQNIGGKKDQGDIWISVRTESNQWSAPVHAGPVINNAGYNAVGGFSLNGDLLFLLGHYYPSGSIPRTQGISVSRNTGRGWSTPENLSIPYFQNKGTMLTGAVVANGSVFVYAAETYGTRGVEDLYVVVRAGDGTWSPPRNLGDVINTPFQELSPFLSADGTTLYFSSNGRKGFGSFDVFASQRLDDSWASWSAPVNMGSEINSEGRELFFRAQEQAGYFLYSSTTNSDGYGDIRMRLSDEPFRMDSSLITTPFRDSIVHIVEVDRQPADDKNVRVYGKVVDAKTGEAIDAALLFSAPDNGITIRANTSDGYSGLVPSTDDYTIRIEASGYVSTMEKLAIHTYEMKDLEMNFRLQPVEVGTTVNLKDVLFEQGKTVLLPSSYPELDLVVSFLKSNPKVRIDLAGHTDNRGIPGQNVKLSQARVDRVRDYLVTRGIEKKRISGKGYGGAKPIASNDSEETRQLNRRVEFTIKRF
jgi:outer membrane protein OmpA-like peptidoglycan-associated protein